ncbi:MAG TPA: type 1 glutamine amidotransferase domain-containing protein [Solirubrobacterales bacterium]
MADELKGKRVAFLMANEGVEQVELTEPLEAVRKAGAEADLIATEAGRIQAFNHLDKADTFEVDRTTAEVSADEYDGAVLPGGVANPDNLRTDEKGVEFLRSFFEAGKPVAAICHAPWMLVEADVVDGRTLTSYPSLQTDVRNAGGNWVNEECVVDSGLVTSRKPDDLPAFCAKVVEELAEGVHADQREKTTA